MLKYGHIGYQVSSMINKNINAFVFIHPAQVQKSPSCTIRLSQALSLTENTCLSNVGGRQLKTLTDTWRTCKLFQRILPLNQTL